MSADNFWNVPNPCWVHLKDHQFVNSTVKLTNGVKMVIVLCDEHAKQMRGMDSDNQSQNIYELIKPGEVVEMQLFPVPPD